ncbi:CDP-glycerol glycerophosphotransferase family protein [Microlunatus sp. GCM10028923]|uniref:CDP-glycerol glycerophosphotransferase family protein n=1 Tax=Microlunatus sp. GCM10028923 TaxID=3273400 RepID=UPI003610289B
MRAAIGRLLPRRRGNDTADGEPLPVITSWNLPGAPAETSADPRVGRADRARLGRALRTLRPTFAMPYAGHGGARYQCQMWEPYLAASGEPYLLLTSDAGAADLIRQVTRAPLLLVPDPTPDDLELVLPKTVRAAFYVQNSKRNRTFLKLDRMTHVWLNHGDSDKPANFNQRHAEYDRIVTCGEAGIERYAAHGIEIPRDQFDVLGRPQAGDIAEGPRPGATPTTVLYAPTWRGIDARYDYTSLPLATRLIEALLDRELTVIFRGHPFGGRQAGDRTAIAEAHMMLAEDRAQSGRKHLWGAAAELDRSLAECINAADALISDVSAVVTDFLASGRPYAMTAMSEPDADAFRAAFPISRAGYVIDRDLADLDRVLDDLFGPDPLAELRAERRTYYLGPFHGSESAEAVADYVRDLTRGRRLTRR